MLLAALGRASGMETRTKDTGLVRYRLVNDCVLATLDGRLEEAVQAGERLAAETERLGMAAFGRLYRRELAFRPLALLGKLTEFLLLDHSPQEKAEALEHLDFAISEFREMKAGMIYNIGRLCGGAAVLLAEPNRARDYYGQALDVCTRARFRPEIALTLLETAELTREGVP